MSASAMTLHEECWLMLPWLANGRLDAAERARLDQHVRACAACARELQLERGWCDTLTAPESITFTPGPAFRQPMERIEEAPEYAVGAPATAAALAARS